MQGTTATVPPASGGVGADAEKKAEEQYRKMGAAFSSNVLQILSFCLGETVPKLQKAMNPEVAERTALEDLLRRLDAKSKRKRAARERQKTRKRI